MIFLADTRVCRVVEPASKQDRIKKRAVREQDNADGQVKVENKRKEKKTKTLDLQSANEQSVYDCNMHVLDGNARGGDADRPGDCASTSRANGNVDDKHALNDDGEDGRDTSHREQSSSTPDGRTAERDRGPGSGTGASARAGAIERLATMSSIKTAVKERRAGSRLSLRRNSVTRASGSSGSGELSLAIVSTVPVHSGTGPPGEGCVDDH